MSTPGAKSATRLVLSGSSLITMMRATPSAASWRVSCGTVSVPSTGWPPVMATASLNSSL
jgi:ABC-type proline/glycine betaine transport system substrate-binding protein